MLRGQCQNLFLFYQGWSSTLAVPSDYTSIDEKGRGEETICAGQFLARDFASSQCFGISVSLPLLFGSPLYRIKGSLIGHGKILKHFDRRRKSIEAQNVSWADFWQSAVRKVLKVSVPLRSLSERFHHVSYARYSPGYRQTAVACRPRIPRL